MLRRLYKYDVGTRSKFILFKKKSIIITNLIQKNPYSYHTHK